MTELIAVPGLTAAGCGQRQQLMRDRLRINGLDAALLTLPQHVHYLSGHWEPPVRATALALLTDGPSVLALSSDSHDHITCADCVTRAAAQRQFDNATQGRKVGRNEQCPCGSGKKYKRCHGR